jgi:putative flippase GtrA
MKEGARYFLASTAAFAVDAGTYVALIRLGEVHYLMSAPVGFTLGIAVIYVLSTRWVFAHRRLADSHWELVIFVVIGIAGLLLNEAVIYLGVERFSLSYELAKLASAAVVFGFNFSARKLLLFTRM